MKKLFFCLFSTIFIALCVWLGLNTESYAYYTTDNDIHYIANNSDTDYKNLFKNCNDFTDVMAVLEEIDSFTLRSNRYIELCNYSELFSDNYCYTINTRNGSYHQIELFFSIPNNSYNLGKYSFDTNGINLYYTTPSVYMCVMRINIYNSNNELYEWYYEYLNYNATFVSPKAQPNVNYTNFNNNYTESYTNLTLTYNNDVLSGTPSPVEPPAEGGYGGFFETIIGVITDEYNAVVDFFTNLPQIVAHIFIPTQEEYEDLIDRFGDQITDRFLIIPLTRNGESYDNTDKYAFIGGNKPHLLIYGYDFDMNELYTALRTPINFGYVQDSNVQSFWYRVDNSNVTPYFIINFVIMVNFIAMNMVLYNKFFDKE